MGKTLSKGLRFKIFKRDGFQCQYCGRCPPETILVVDHKISRVNGGSNKPENLITSCQDCNLGKGSSNFNDPFSFKRDPVVNQTGKINISLSVPVEWNEKRKLFAASWRDILKQGFDSLNPNKDSQVQDPVISKQIKIAVEALMQAHNANKKKPLSSDTPEKKPPPTAL